MSDGADYECQECGYTFHADNESGCPECGGVCEQMTTEVDQLRAALAASQEREQRYEAALEKIVQWSIAYPLDVFPEPDFKRVRELLEAGGITLDSVSASNMRHVVEGVGKIARAALAGKEEG